jgi:hypothetical protein
VESAGQLVRGEIRNSDAQHIQECYRTLAVECVRRGATRALIVGADNGDAVVHNALLDAIRSLALAGLPPDFRLALVPGSVQVAGVYRVAVAEAARYGIAARQFVKEDQAIAWLSKAS